LYIIAGIFGIVAFAACGPGGYPLNYNVEPPKPWTYDDIMGIQNILQAPYNIDDDPTHVPVGIYISLFGLLIVVTFASPFCVLPMKDSVEDVMYKETKLDGKKNLIWTFVLVIVCMFISFGLTSLGVVATLLGATTNTAIGFWLPILFYLKSTKKESKWTNTKICAYILFGFVTFSSIMTLSLMIQSLVKGSGDDRPDNN